MERFFALVIYLLFPLYNKKDKKGLFEEATGGTIFLNSDLQRIDIFGNPKTISYLSTPISVGIMQPIFGFNALKWDKRIEPLRYDEAKRMLNEEMEGVGIRATELFFNLLMAQMNYIIQEKNVANNDTLYKISKGRYNLGKIAENDLLQMELNSMNASNNLAQAELDVQLRTLELRTFLNLKGDENITLIEPGDLPGIFIDEGPLFIYKEKNKKPFLYKDINRGSIFKKPIIVLINELSASASELFSNIVNGKTLIQLLVLILFSFYFLNYSSN